LNRSKSIQHYRSDAEVSVLIVGAGVNGIGLFRDLALNGVDVLLIDRSDFCSGASAASSHMAHGGIRYLENGEFRLVREAVQERNRLLRNAPHFVKPLATTIPIFKTFSGLLNAPLKFLGWLNRPAERGAVVIKLGLMLYDAFTGAGQDVPRHSFQSGPAARQRTPALNPDVRYAATYFDGAILQPERLCIEMVLDGESAGDNARALNYVSLHSADDTQVVLKDELSGELFRVKPRVVVNAAGPWIDAANAQMGTPTQFMGGTKGSHLVLDHPELRAAIADREYFFENADGRIVLIYPYFDRVMIGTTDLPIENPDEAVCTPEERAYFFEMVGRVFPDVTLNADQVVFQFSGVRPLPASTANTTGQISRDHSIVKIDRGSGSFGVLSLVGGKWTTFRAFAEQAADQVLGQLGRSRTVSTRTRVIGGGADYPSDPESWVEHAAARLQLDTQAAAAQFRRYGTRLDAVYAASGDQGPQPLSSHPDWTVDEIRYLALNEKVVHLDDLVLRRSLLAMLGELDRVRLKEIADALARALDWSDDQLAAELTRCQDILEARHGMRI
jgi:glycerol-3-phosphate dehydrogenase